eukprot:3233402-Pyramimonas_sp.AAC.1
MGRQVGRDVGRSRAQCGRLGDLPRGAVRRLRTRDRVQDRAASEAARGHAEVSTPGSQRHMG